MSSAALVVTGLTKTYKTGFLRQHSRTVLGDVTFDVARGEIFGYLGPNGSGKTTTLKLILGLVARDRGTVSVLGHDLDDPAWRASVGYLPEHPYFYDYLTAAEYLDYAARLSGMPAPSRHARTRHLLEQVGLGRSMNSPLRRFSKGMLQRVGVAQAIVNDPQLVFLDEPMSGLDPLGRRMVRNLILGLKQEGKTVFFSTHILSDAETLCDRVGLIRDGQLMKVGRLDDILNLDVEHLEVLVSGLTSAAADALTGGVATRQSVGERWRLEVEERALGRVIQAVEAAKGRILSVQPIRQSLEDYFFKEMAPRANEERWLLED